MNKFKITWRIGPMIFKDEEKWQSFLRLIDRKTGVADEVALYISDDMFPSLSPLDDKRKQTEFCKERFKDLRKRGATVGINVWPTLHLWEVERMHYPNMRRMVDIDGNVIDNLACPTSAEFIDYMCEKYTIFAQSGADFIWMDDDSRFTHMDGRYPCFCDDCVKGFQNGAYSSREELVCALNKSENRDLRVAWSSYGAERLAKLCKALRAAVDKVDYNIDIGLMTVGATHTTFSGDYIEKCMKAFRSRRGRPGHDLYSDNQPDKLVWKTLEVGRQVLEYPDTATDIFWEEDSHPQGYLNKSLRTRQNEISMALMAGCNGIAFNHASMNGNLDQSLGREIDELNALRPRWERFFEFSKDLKWCGMWPLHSWFMTAKAECESFWLKEEPFGDNKNPNTDISLAGKIGVYGLPLTTDSKNACATLLSGKTLTALTFEELKKVFSGNVYMDALALEALEKLGLAEWAGVKINPNVLPSKPCVMTEHEFNGEFANHRYRGTHGLDTRTLIALDNSVEWLGYRPNVFGEGDLCYISKYQNAMGGKVVVNGYSAWQFTDNPHNLYQFASVAEWFDAPVRLKWENNNLVSRVAPFIRTDGKRAAVMLLNASLDTTNPFEIIVKGDMKRAVLLNPDGSETELKLTKKDNRVYVDIPTISAWDIAFILID